MSTIDYFGYATHSAAVVIATFDLREDLHDFGHAHGLCLLVASKLCREMNSLRGLAAASTTTWEDTRRRLPEPPFGLVLQLVGFVLVWLWRFLASNWTATALALGALGAAIVEVFDEAKNVQEGAILLALIDLLELSQQAGIVIPVLHRVRGLKLLLAAGATAFACWEALDTEDLGTHHGVLMLAIFKLVRTLLRSRKLMRWIVQWLRRNAKRVLKLLQTVGIFRSELHSHRSSRDSSSVESEDSEDTPTKEPQAKTDVTTADE